MVKNDDFDLNKSFFLALMQFTSGTSAYHEVRLFVHFCLAIRANFERDVSLRSQSWVYSWSLQKNYISEISEFDLFKSYRLSHLF